MGSTESSLTYISTSIAPVSSPYEEVMTPYERLKSLSQSESYLRPDVTFEQLETIVNQMSDNQFAERMVNARSKLFQQISRFAVRVA